VAASRLWQLNAARQAYIAAFRLPSSECKGVENQINPYDRGEND
jgi:hypothetical protein